jgi:hypothetical protein
VGGDAACAILILLLLSRVMSQLAQAFPIPALRKVREGQSTHSIGGCQPDQKSGPAANCCSAGTGAHVTNVIVERHL